MFKKGIILFSIASSLQGTEKTPTRAKKIQGAMRRINEKKNTVSSAPYDLRSKDKAIAALKQECKESLQQQDPKLNQFVHKTVSQIELHTPLPQERKSRLKKVLFP